MKKRKKGSVSVEEKEKKKTMMTGGSSTYTGMTKVAIVILVAMAILPSAYEARPRHRRGASVHTCGTPAVCRCMDDLRWVDCSNRDLMEMPEFPRFVYLSSLRLFMNGNKMSSIPDDEYWMKWKSLESGDFSDNPVCQDSEVTLMGDRLIEIISEVCPTRQPVYTTATPTDLPPEPSKRRRPPFLNGKNASTTTTMVTTTTTTTTVSSFTTEGDEDETERTSTGATDGTTGSTREGPRPTDKDRGTVDKSRERIIMLGSLSVSIPLGFAAISCCIRGMYKKVRRSVQRGKSERELAKEAREAVRRGRRGKCAPPTLSALFDCACNTGVQEVPHFENPHYNFSITEEENIEEEEEAVIFTNQPGLESVRMRTPSLSKEE